VQYVHYWADLQSVHGFRCYDNRHVCNLIAFYTANAYSAERDMSATACTRSMAGSLWLPCGIGQAIIFCPVVFSFFLFSFFFVSLPNLSGRRLDVYHGVALVRI